MDGHPGCMSRPYGDVRDALCEGNFSRVASTRGITPTSSSTTAATRSRDITTPPQRPQRTLKRRTATRKYLVEIKGKVGGRQ